MNKYYVFKISSNYLHPPHFNLLLLWSSFYLNLVNHEVENVNCLQLVCFLFLTHFSSSSDSSFFVFLEIFLLSNCFVFPIMVHYSPSWQTQPFLLCFSIFKLNFSIILNSRTGFLLLCIIILIYALLFAVSEIFIRCKG